MTVNTGVGVTEEADVGEVIGQGTVGGALASQVNIDKGVDRYFRGSCDETSYGTVRLQPIIFQDDVARIASGIRTAQAGNMKLANVMKEKQLKVHPDKTGYIVIGNAGYQEQIKKELEVSPIMFGNILTKNKIMDKYLGDMVHCEGLEASINATIEDRIGKVTASMHEVKAIIDDYHGTSNSMGLAHQIYLEQVTQRWPGLAARQVSSVLLLE